MTYDKPQVTDLGTLLEMTEAGGTVGFEDGTGKHIDASLLGAAGVSVGLLP